jgi:hypothetical protein
MTQKNSFRFLKMKEKDMELLSYVFLSSTHLFLPFIWNSTSVQILRDVISNFKNFYMLAIVLAFLNILLIFTKYSTDLEQILYYLSILKIAELY